MIILKLMKFENATLPSPRAALKAHPKGSQNGSQNDARKRPRNGLSGESSNAQNALLSLCFRDSGCPQKGTILDHISGPLLDALWGRINLLKKSGVSPSGAGLGPGLIIIA